MANQHFANLGDVWKHLLLTQVISWLRPGHYVETHAGSAIYRLVDDVERGLGAEMFLSTSSEIEPLRSSPYRRHILEFARGAEPVGRAVSGRAGRAVGPERPRGQQP
jgi:hypothetical protein